jgi:hypothetical protein
VDLPFVSHRHAASIAVGEADIQSQMAIVRTRPGGPGGPGRPPLADITAPPHRFAPFASIVVTEPRSFGAGAGTACPPSRPN